MIATGSETLNLWKIHSGQSRFVLRICLWACLLVITCFEIVNVSLVRQEAQEAIGGKSMSEILEFLQPELISVFAARQSLKYKSEIPLFWTSSRNVSHQTAERDFDPGHLKDVQQFSLVIKIHSKSHRQRKLRTVHMALDSFINWFLIEFQYIGSVCRCRKATRLVSCLSSWSLKNKNIKTIKLSKVFSLSSEAEIKLSILYWSISPLEMFAHKMFSWKLLRVHFQFETNSEYLTTNWFLSIRSINSLIAKSSPS